MTKKMPIWILIWCLLMGLLPLGFVAVGYFNPAYFGEEWAAQGVSRLGGVFGNYVARNMASALIMFFALSQRSAAMLIVALLMRIFSDIFDTAHNAVVGTLEVSYFIEASILIIGCSLAIYFLWGIGKAQNQQ